MEAPKLSDDLIAEIKENARIFTNDNIRFPFTSDYLMIENAMLSGASSAISKATKLLVAETIV